MSNKIQTNKSRAVWLGNAPVRQLDSPTRILKLALAAQASRGPGFVVYDMVAVRALNHALEYIKRGGKRVGRHEGGKL